jgi:pimeloyl-ACP methyl ester carboxylesterase
VERPPKPQTYHAVTDDGWRIALHRYPRPGRRCPVLLVHGLASNRHNFDFPDDEISFAKYLWNRGWDVWIVELRGAGRSHRPGGWGWRNEGWTMDHHVLHDLPAAVRFVLNRTRHRKLHWVGHSLGGLLVAPFINTHSDGFLKSAVLAASPVTGIPKPMRKWTYVTEPFLRILPVVPYRTMARLAGLKPEWIFQGPLPRLFVRGNMDADTLRRGAAVAVNDLSSRAVLQFQDWMRSKRFRSDANGIRYHVDFKKVTLPVLFVAGSHDPFTSVGDLRRALERIASRKKAMLVFGRKYGHAANYSHWDLILGKNAPREVYPAIAGWLQKHD